MAGARAVFSISGPDLTTDQVTVEAGSFTIGRNPANNLRLNVQQVSSNHARIDYVNGQFLIEDLNSTNGTHVNADRIEPKTPTPLKIGDVIRMGPFILTLTHIEKETSAAPPPPPPLEAAEKKSVEPPPPSAESPAEPVVYKTDPPPQAEMQTVQPQPTQAKAEPPPEPKPANPDEVAVKSPPAQTNGKRNGHAPATRDLEIEIFRPAPRAFTNGFKPKLEPYVPIEGVPIPPGESRYMKYLPGVFSDSSFLKRYLLIMESILAPLEWGIDSFEQFYNPLVTTPDWLQWIGDWFDILIHPSVPIERQRAVVKELGILYLQRGTRKGLLRLLELYFGVTPQLVENETPPSSFRVILPLGKENSDLNRALAEQLITICKPAHTGFTLEVP